MCCRSVEVCLSLEDVFRDVDLRLLGIGFGDWLGFECSFGVWCLHCG
jgi:hypothetical protein